MMSIAAFCQSLLEKVVKLKTAKKTCRTNIDIRKGHRNQKDQPHIYHHKEASSLMTSLPVVFGIHPTYPSSLFLPPSLHHL